MAVTNNKKPRCKYCNSEQIVLDATAIWDDEKGCFVINEIMDKGHFCLNCDGLTKIG